MVVINKAFTIPVKNLNVGTKIFNNWKGIVQLNAAPALITKPEGMPSYGIEALPAPIIGDFRLGPSYIVHNLGIIIITTAQPDPIFKHDL